MTTSEDFILKFHSLDGTTLREKKKSFYFLLTSINPLESNVLDDIIQRLNPSTYLEETYELELLIYFKRTNDLINRLIEGDEIGAKKILRQDWFVRGLMDKYTPSKCMEEFVPKLSFSIRSKLFKRISMILDNVNLIEDFCEKVLESYGISSALVFLSGCRKHKIEEIFIKFSIKFSATQLKLLFQKDKNIIMHYFNVLSENCFDVDNYKWRSLFLYIGKQDPVFYFDLCDKFNINKLKLGRRSTKRYIDIEREKIVNKPLDYYRFLRKDALVRKLGTDFPIFFKNLFPQNLYMFHFNYNRSLIKFYPRKKQYELYLNTFEEVYKKSLWDHVQYMDENLIELVPDKNDRERWIAKYEKRQNIKKYMIKKRKCAMFFIEDKKEIVIKDKKTIFNTLISTCKLMNDYNAFTNILKSFCERHRNSDVTIIYNFLRTVHKELDLSKFGDEHWQYIYYIISIQLFKKQQIFHPIYFEYMKYLYLNEQPINEHVLKFLNEAPLTLSKFNYDNKDFQKALQQLFLKYLPEVTNRQKEIGIEIALSIMKWNARYPLETICFSDEKDILNAVEELNTNEKINKKTMKVFKYLICNQNENQTSSNLDNIYWSNYEKFNDTTITQWFVKYKPTVLKEHINKIGIILKNSNINLVHNLKKYSHLDIPNTIIKSCLEDLKTAERFKCSGIIYILILFMESKDLYSFMQQYVPQVERVDVDNCDEEIQKTYAIQQALARYCQSSTNVKMLLPVLMDFCRGDFLKSALPSLYSSFHRIPENQLDTALAQLSNRAVSVRKHAIFLTSLIHPVKQILSKYKQIQLSEKNSSVKEHMFLSCYKFFIRNETPECWIILRNYLEQLNKKRKDVLEMITNVHLFPVSYRPEYTVVVWNILEKYKKGDENIDDNMLALINNLTTKDITHLDIEFCFNVIENKLFDIEECSIDDNVFDFARKFLLYGQNSQRKADLMGKIFREMKEKALDDIEKNKSILCMLHKVCLKFVKDILTMKTYSFDKLFPKLFNIALKKTFSFEEIFEETLLLDLVEFKIESGNIEPLLSGQMSRLLTIISEKYGYLILNGFKNFLHVVLDILYVNDDFAVLNFLRCFLEDKSLIHCKLVIDLLPHVSCIDTDERTKNAYEVLLKKLEDQNQIIKVCLYGKLKDI